MTTSGNPAFACHPSRPRRDSWARRVPYDTHAFAGQGDYSEHTSPLLKEYKVPLELLQQVYLSPHLEKTGSTSSVASSSAQSTSPQPNASSSSTFHAEPSTRQRSPNLSVLTNRNDAGDANGSTGEPGEPPITPLNQTFASSAEGLADTSSPLPAIKVTPSFRRRISDEQARIQGPLHMHPRKTSGGPSAALAGLGLGPSPNIVAPNSNKEQQGDSTSSSTDPPGSGSHLYQAAGWLSFTPSRDYPPVKLLSTGKRKRILVTGGAGFVGSHLVDRLMFLGHEVTVLDNFFSGSKTGVSHWVGHPHFELVRHDVTLPFHIECDMIYHLACPASPRAYQYNQIKTMKTNFLGTLNMLGLAKRTKARFLLSSTSEVYGSPAVHPQPETYWGNVNPIGPRACYDEGKRVAEALTFGYMRQDGVDVRVARIFNSFGPRMTPGDGRVVSNFIFQALKGEDITIYGDGSQTRSLLFVHDLVDGLILLMNGKHEGPINIGSPFEGSILSWAQVIIETVDEVLVELSGGDASVLANRRKSGFVFKEMPEDDPPRRQADITRAKELLNWQPMWSVKEGLKETIRSFLESDIVDIDLPRALRGKLQVQSQPDKGQ